MYEGGTIMILAEHKCDGVTGWDSIYADQEGNWIFNASAGDSTTEITYCPFCGHKLEYVEPVVRELKAQPMTFKQIHDALNETRMQGLAEAINNSLITESHYIKEGE
jgi:hypothetical protein